MKVLILHKIGYPKIAYHTGIDHDRHDVTYIGTAAKLADIPAHLRCRKIEREDRGEDIHGSVMAALHGEGGFERVISLSEYELLEAAKVREALGAPGPTYEQARLVRDKVAMKGAAAKAGIDVPRFVALSSLNEGPAKLPWSGRTVLKPTHGAGSEDVMIFDSVFACLQALAGQSTGVKALDQDIPQMDGYELEEFVTGPIVHLDGLVQDGRVYGLLGSRYLGTCQRYNENEPLGSYQIDLDSKTQVWVQRVIEALEIRVGAFHMEAIESDRGLVFLEIGNRTGGAGVPQATSLAWDADFQKLELQLLVDDCTTDLSQLGRRGQYYGWYVLPGHAYDRGHWVATPAVEALKADPRSVTWHERPESEGYDHRPDYDLPSVPYGGIVGAPQSHQVRDYMLALFDAIRWQERSSG